MSSNKLKKICLNLSVILALILFLCLYMIDLNKRIATDTKTPSGSKVNDTGLYEYKNIYAKDNPGELIKVYINVFPTRDEVGNYHDLSSFDLVADWDRDYNPLLDANIQFLSVDKELEIYKTITPNATIRVRGDKGTALKSYRIKLMDGIDAFNGQSVFNINKNLRDPSRIANKLAHDLIKGLNHISGFRTHFFQVYIKDANPSADDNEFYNYGLYTHIEQPNKTYLRNHGLDENGSIYRAENFYFQLTPELKYRDDPEYSKEAFETVLGIREGKDHTKLINMLKDINNPTLDFNHVFHTYFNEDNYLTWLSINILLGNTDAMSGGFLLYNPDNSLVWYLLPWDFNGIFSWMEDGADRPNIYDKLIDVDLHRRYIEQEGNLEKLHDKIEELISDPFSPSKIKSLKKSYKPVLLELMDTYPDNVLLSMPISKLMAYIDKIDEYIYKNYQDFLDWYVQFM